jgi:rfaE bifunctional protein kinase chain/domain
MFSSSKFIDEKKVNLDIEKLEFLLAEKKISFDELEKILQKFKNIKVSVVGDTIIDQQIYCHHTITQNKTPTLNLSYENNKKFVGGAAIVAKHLRAAGAEVRFISFSGKDSDTNFIIKELKKDQIKNTIFIDPKRVTNLKQSIYSKNYNLLKISKTNKQSLNQKELAELVKELKKIKNGLIIFSDFRHGIFDRTTIPVLSKNIKKNIIKIADSQVASRWGNISDFKSFDLITPNENEARFSTSDQDSNISSLSRKLFKISNCKNMILKLSENGALCVQKKSGKFESYLIPSLVNKLVDPIGSGDALLAYSSLAFAVTKCHARAGLIGTIAAACKIELQGNIPIKNIDVINKIKKLKAELNLN